MEYYKYIKLTVSNFRNTLFYKLKQFVNKFKVSFIKTIEVNNIFMDDSEEDNEDNEYKDDNEYNEYKDDNYDNQEEQEDEEDKEGVPFSKRKRGLFISIYDSDIESSDEDSEDQQQEHEEQPEHEDQEEQEEQEDIVT